jgi:hypothetical protein
MGYEEQVKQSRERLARAEAAMDAYLHRCDYDDNHFNKIKEEVRTARAELLRRLSTSWPGVKIKNLKDQV